MHLLDAHTHFFSRTFFDLLVAEAPGRDLPEGAGVLNLKEAPPEFIQDDDLWGGFMRTAVSDAVIPPISEFETGDHAGLMPPVDDSATEAAPAEKVAPAEEVAPPAEVAAVPQAAEAPAVPEASEAVGTSSAWSPSKENVVWDWQVIEERIVEMTESA